MVDLEPLAVARDSGVLPSPRWLLGHRDLVAGRRSGDDERHLHPLELLLTGIDSREVVASLVGKLVRDQSCAFEVIECLVRDDTTDRLTADDHAVRDDGVDCDVGEAGLTKESRQLAADVGIPSTQSLPLDDGVDEVSSERRLGLEEGREGEVRIDDDQPPAGTEDTPKLQEYVVNVRDVLEEQPREDDVEGRVGQARRRGTPLDQPHAIRPAHTLACVREHRWIQIEAGNGRSRKALEEKSGHESGTAARLENAHVVAETVAREHSELLRPEHLGLNPESLDLDGHVAKLSLADPVRA